MRMDIPVTDNKKKKYLSACEEKNSTFTFLVCCVCGWYTCKGIYYL